MHREHPTTLSRRHMLKATAAAGAMAVGLPGARALAKAAVPKTFGISLQLYSVRGDCGKDIDAVFEQVAKMGFDAVEFAGYHKYSGDAKALRGQLDAQGLKVAGTHIGTGLLSPEALPKTIEFHKTIGCKYLVVPGDGRFTKPDESKELAEIFNKAAEILKKEDMKCGYHNHTHEFSKDGDKTYWELFAERTCDDVILQQDVGWSTVAGQDPPALIRKYPGRSQIIHCKPSMVSGDKGRPIIGEDSVKWEPIFEACREAGGTEWLTIEQEAYLPNTS
ncbi:MAG TPA: sugar phosphate isomerase/epimerase, partial [Thermoguttaceae bacterium]|nr:sugar phosphate isomerase/epimerase [Thermoguttaceae bacterium]